MQSGSTESMPEKRLAQHSSTQLSEFSQTNSDPGHSRKESSPIIQIEGEIDGNPQSGRGSTLSHSTTDDAKRLSLEVSDDSYASPGSSPAVSRRSTLEKKRSDPSSRYRRDHSPNRSGSIKLAKGSCSSAPRSPSRGNHEFPSLSQSANGLGGLHFPVSPSKRAARTEAYPQVCVCMRVCLCICVCLGVHRHLVLTQHTAIQFIFHPLFPLSGSVHPHTVSNTRLFL